MVSLQQLLLKLVKSKCRYSTLIDQAGLTFHSTPPPTVQPVRVLLLFWLKAHETLPLHIWPELSKTDSFMFMLAFSQAKPPFA